MSLGLLAKLVGALVVLAVAGGVGAVTYLNHSRPAALGLASVTPHSTPAASPADPLSMVCRRPAGAAGLWVIAARSRGTAPTSSSPSSRRRMRPLRALMRFVGGC